jgi:hypothetical protein
VLCDVTFDYTEEVRDAYPDILTLTRPFFHMTVQNEEGKWWKNKDFLKAISCISCGYIRYNSGTSKISQLKLGPEPIFL